MPRTDAQYSYLKRICGGAKTPAGSFFHYTGTKGGAYSGLHKGKVVKGRQVPVSGKERLGQGKEHLQTGDSKVSRQGLVCPGRGHTCRLQGQPADSRISRGQHGRG
ncbi:hypothetical protein CENSYa_1059 [Cenarchaeum symbiosum A]|uniref:Uncharacterized protein n=1 Tax=Cenarchaeum symbiosum (strain A) TaxID=414004 RepID=A0RWH2_CENSY|nr:hypothetical protein CENSYa_1059 [Cenarchaeum symbiosum A]